MKVFHFSFAFYKARNRGEKTAPEQAYLPHIGAIFSLRSASPCADQTIRHPLGSRACCQKHNAPLRAQKSSSRRRTKMVMMASFAFKR